MDSNNNNTEKKIVICVSGAADVAHCGPEVLESARELGREVAEQGHVLTTGATSGFPHASALAYQEAKGYLSLGFSPATDEREHTDLYFLPLDGCDLIVYTGFGFPMRDIILTKSCDAMVVGCGRIGTIHEFTVAFESNIPVGILEGPWSTDEVIRDIIRNSNRTNPKVIFDSNPKRIIERLAEMARENKDRRELGDVEMFQEIKAKV
ncbi:hypothetical protein SDC9_21641 [bioreactor metagenome]|uniref:Uncharacterized protein n=1 Tax=bioreactor metagenome TaxID=1076179 RepID=A0A644UAC1_9ZZZZ|nr:hypothetical protein [Candidatus Elulimicrobiales bacterium]